jgi:hypothetical protein
MSERTNLDLATILTDCRGAGISLVGFWRLQAGGGVTHLRYDPAAGRWSGELTDRPDFPPKRPARPYSCGDARLGDFARLASAERRPDGGWQLTFVEPDT